MFYLIAAYTVPTPPSSRFAMAFQLAPATLSASISCRSTLTRGRPSVRPFAFALRIPARTLSAISDRPSSATAPRTVNIILPVGVEVSICSL